MFNPARSFVFTVILVILGSSLTACSTVSTDSSEASDAKLEVAPTLARPEATPDRTQSKAATGNAAPPLPDLGPAPDFTNEVWINTETPLTLDRLRGKVVLVEFWTYGWINCQQVIPWVREWYETYRGQEFEVVGVHYPEFEYEKDYGNAVAATQRLDVSYPVAIDNDGRTWRAYKQRYWPTRYVLDKTGHIRFKHIGEGAYEETEAVIQALMAEPDLVE